METQPRKPVVMVTGADLAPQALQLLTDFEVVFAGASPTQDDLRRLAQEVKPTAIIVRYGKIGPEIMDAADGLRVIAKHGVGLDSIDLAAARERGIEVRAALGTNANAVAEHTWALILACSKNIAQLDARMRKGLWDKATHKSSDLAGKTLGVIGIGAIGRRVAEIGLAVGMQIIAFDPMVKESLAHTTLVSLDELLQDAEVISLNCPLTDQNRNLINRSSIAKMKDGVILVNTARGGLVDESALLEALHSGKIKAAGLDTFEREPMVGSHAMQGVDNLVMTPHVGGLSGEAYVRMGMSAAKNVLDVISGEPA